MNKKGVWERILETERAMKEYAERNGKTREYSLAVTKLQECRMWWERVDLGEGE